MNGTKVKPKMQTNEKQMKPKLDLMTAQCRCAMRCRVGLAAIREPISQVFGKRNEKFLEMHGGNF